MGRSVMGRCPYLPISFSFIFLFSLSPLATRKRQTSLQGCKLQVTALMSLQTAEQIGRRDAWGICLPLGMLLLTISFAYMMLKNMLPHSLSLFSIPPLLLPVDFLRQSPRIHFVRKTERKTHVTSNYFTQKLWIASRPTTKLIKKAYYEPLEFSNAKYQVLKKLCRCMYL